MHNLNIQHNSDYGVISVDRLEIRIVREQLDEFRELVNQSGIDR